jgi:hypothetical protein
LEVPLVGVKIRPIAKLRHMNFRKTTVVIGTVALLWAALVGSTSAAASPLNRSHRHHSSFSAPIRTAGSLGSAPSASSSSPAGAPSTPTGPTTHATTSTAAPTPPTSTPTTVAPRTPPSARSTSAGVTPIRPASRLGVISSASGCASSPSSCGYPDATNTGVIPGTALASSGCITVHTANAVIQNLTINQCSIDVYAQNVTIRNVNILISASTDWAIFVAKGGSVTIDHVSVSGVDQSGSSVEYAVLSETSSPVIVSNSNLQKCADCIQGENITATGNFIHNMANPPGAHVDGIQCNSSCGVTVTGNTIFNQWSQTSDVALFGDFGTPKNSVIAGNLFAGGGYSVYGGTTGSTGIQITNNRFARLYYANGGYFGPVAHFSSGGAGNVWSGNIWDDSRAAVSDN